jgi:hypothetical protein
MAQGNVVTNSPPTPPADTTRQHDPPTPPAKSAAPPVKRVRFAGKPPSPAVSVASRFSLPRCHGLTLRAA